MTSTSSGKGSTLYSIQTLPTGTLTFLFTDIEGSTQLWEHYPEQMRTAMKRHDALIESAVEQFGGVVIRPRGEGDSRFAVFAYASGALCAAIEIQLRLDAEPWSLPPLRVRIGLHSGEADLRDGDYYGRSVNRCARLRNAAHGGQILVSECTFCLVRDDLPAGASLHDLGEYRLKDLEHPERIYQLVGAGLPARFPPLITPEKLRHNLPVELTSFVGRQREIEELERLVAESRLVTLHGMGGAGKTRLAVRMGQVLQLTFPDGVWFIDLSPLSKSSYLEQHIMNTLGVKEEPGFPLSQTLVDALRDKNLLIILDNCEQLLPDLARLTETLLRSTARLRILATSREKLGIPGEILWRIPPLSSPEASQEPVLERFLKFEAVALFRDRARAARSDFEITRENAWAVAQICAHLDGIPLAIELAAARVSVLTVEEIVSRLDRRFGLLVGTQTAIPRQQTLRAMIRWSYDLLGEEEQRLLHRLSVFAGGWTLDAAEQVCSENGMEATSVMDFLTSLVDKSFVIGDNRGDHIRYRFLETIQRFCAERLAELQETGEYEKKHAGYFAKLAHESYGKMWGPDQVRWLARLDEEYDNLRRCLSRLSNTEGKEGELLKTAGSLWRYWEIRGHYSEGRSWIENALSVNPEVDDYQRANGLAGAGHLARQQGDYDHARLFHEQSLAIFEKMGFSLNIARQLNALGEIAIFQGDYPEAIVLHEKSLAMREEIGDKEGIAVSLRQLGVIARDRGQYERARELLEQSLAMERELGDKLLTALSLNDLGLVAFQLCEYEWAKSLYEEALSLQRELNARLDISNTLLNLGNVAKDKGDFRQAGTLYQQSLALKRELGDKRGIAQVTATMGEIAVLQGKYPLAKELCEEALASFQELGIQRGILYSMLVLGYVTYYQGDYEAAAAYSEKDLAIAISTDAPQAAGYTRGLMALCRYSEGRLDAAREGFEAALKLFEGIHDCRNAARTYVNLARTAYRQGDQEAAMRYLDQGLAISRDREIRWTLGYVLEIMGLLNRSAGNYQQALELYQESLQLSIEQDNTQGIANCLGALAGLAVVSNQPERATRLFAAAGKLRRDMGAKMSSIDLEEYELYLNMVHEKLDHAAFDAEWAEGYSAEVSEILEDLRHWSGSFQ